MSELPEQVPDQLDQMDQDMLQPNENLVDRGVDDFLDEGYSPPEKPSYLSRHGDVDETLDERLAQEEPEVWDAAPAGETINDGEVGDQRAGRLVDPNGGIGEDTEKDMVADDIGIDGAAASAEEAAVHIVPDSEFY
ncbi:MAG TPA: DUF5709 domain-containing protein [Microlunatus sp.]